MDKTSRRHRQLIRTWNLLVLLRARPRTLAELATECATHQRTIRRDLDALCTVGFPIITSRDDVEKPGRTATWSLAAIPAWPRSAHVPMMMHPSRVEAHASRGGFKDSVRWSR